MENLIYKISNLNCVYSDKTPVLKIADLDIPKGKLVFVIGKSGIGKSTFLETLGLMNNTIGTNKDLSFQFFPEELDNLIELNNSWEKSNYELSQLRKKYFSFIFQSTNLMPNFTAGENMMISLLLGGMSTEDAKQEVLEIMTRLDLAPEVFDKKITELSGGQRQRLAFVRAITANFQVLFGDEPTGNLDKKTAFELMNVLKKIITEKNKTGIIVSHDLLLTLEFADLILPITPIEDQTMSNMGEILNEHLIWKSSDRWLKNNGELVKDPFNYLNTFLGVI